MSLIPGAEARGVTRLPYVVWFAWLLFIACMVGPYFRWEIEYFRSPGPKFHTLLLWLLSLYIVASPVYLRLRDRWRHFEVPALVLVSVALPLFYQPVAVPIAVSIVLSCLSIGRRIARTFGLEFRSDLEALGLAFPLGITVLILLLFLLGLSRLYVWPIFLGLVVLPPLMFRRDTAEVVVALVRLFRAASRDSALRHPMAGVVIPFAFVGLLLCLAVMLSPSIAFDPLAMHLPAARYYAQEHVLRPLASLDYSYFPQGFETLAALAWSLGGQAAAQMIAPLFFGGFLVILFAIARTLGMDNVAALAGVASAGLLPVVHWTGSNSKNDLPMALFEAAALYSFLRWVDTRKRAWIAVGGALLGAAFGIKLVALFAAVPLTGYFAYAISRSKRRVPLTVMFIVLTAGSGLYWQAREFVMTGNPVYPAGIAQAVQQGVSRPGSTPLERIVRTFEIVWDAEFQGQQVFESPLPNPAGISLVVFLPLTILTARKRNRGRNVCLWFCAVYIAYWATAAGALRYAILPVGLLTVLIVGKARQFHKEASWPPIRISINALLGASLIFGVLGTAIIEINAPMLTLFARRGSWDTYLMSALRTYPSLAWLNRNHVEARILGVGNDSRAYAPGPERYYVTAEDDRHVDRTAEACGCEYAVVPADHGPERERARFGLPKTATSVYRDRYYVVYRLAPAVPNRG